MLASFSLKRLNFMCIDSYAERTFTFTPATSIFLDCDSEAKAEALFRKPFQASQVLMPLDVYPFSRDFAWAVDRCGVSWQINLPKP
jgi:predicted 3-demethylubiquinone-9 3-methyltransferase (glyoxalase superfamily)